ncbi:small ribosomal subunit protein mS40 isoform X2 [Melopsittacus undulatus]|uniref:small ribosomal subunit protein mS40 isoform X2 n=1 Tax=Melopsittacus undulatus TaxID=13146 RepID=UPI00146C87BA|nr:28S ribosomal protein S18b, mitochondrial isoform X2 [Melopsittacus undulatus]
MALPMGTALLRAARAGLRALRRPLWAPDTPRLCSTQEAAKPPPSPYEERPWEYLESEEYRSTYGDQPVWFGYRRNHKGSIPPQRTRKACLNVKLLDQFICPHSGVIFHPTHTGVCMKQHKLLSQAIAQAQDHGLLWLQVPFVPTPRGDFSTRHPAVGRTPSPPGPGPWYPWYEWQPPPPAAVARIRRIYRQYLKEGAAPVTPAAPAEGQ